MKNKTVSVKYDAVVAGAGPAGSIAARDMARAGLSVLLLDSKERDGLGHDWWDTVDTEMLKKLDIPFPEPPERVAGFEMTVLLPGGGVAGRQVMDYRQVNVDRKNFAQRLIAMAEAAGAKTQFGAQVEGPIFEEGRVAGIRVSGVGGKISEIRCPVSIDATGLAGALRSKLPASEGIETGIRNQDTVVTYREIREDTSNAGRSIVAIRAGGEVRWLSRTESGLADIFACAVDLPGRRDPRAIVNETIKSEGGVGGKILRGGSYARIPVRRGLDMMSAPGLLLIGDCACMAKPMNGSGISSGMWGGALAARAVAEARGKGRFGRAALWSFNSAYKKSTDAAYAKIHALQKFALGESDEDFSLIMGGGFMSEQGSWNMEEELDAARNAHKLPKILSIGAKRPDFFARLAGTYVLMSIIETHYKDFPAEYSHAAFMKWKRRTNSLFRMIPVNY